MKAYNKETRCRILDFCSEGHPNEHFGPFFCTGLSREKNIFTLLRRPTNLSKNYWYFFCSEISIITVNIAENPLQTVINPMKLYIFNPHRHGIFMVFRCSWVFQYSSYSRLKLKLYDYELLKGHWIQGLFQIHRPKLQLFSILMHPNEAIPN